MNSSTTPQAPQFIQNDINVIILESVVSGLNTVYTCSIGEQKKHKAAIWDHFTEVWVVEVVKK